MGRLGQLWSCDSTTVPILNSPCLSLSIPAHAHASTCLNGLERVTHHGDEHVGEDDDDGYVVESEQKQSDALDDRRGVLSAREARRERAVVSLLRVLDLDLLPVYETKHRPEQAEQRPRQPTITCKCMCLCQKQLETKNVSSSHLIRGSFHK